MVLIINNKLALSLITIDLFNNYVDNNKMLLNNTLNIDIYYKHAVYIPTFIKISKS